jgi:hypothetical protein
MPMPGKVKLPHIFQRVEIKIIEEFVTELPTSPALGKYYMKHKIVLFQKTELWIRTFSQKASNSCIRQAVLLCLNRIFKDKLWTGMTYTLK